MFRDCPFIFAGKSSEDYNLILLYLNNNRDDFNSGGEFGLKTDSIPYVHEQFLYGKDYSEKPLEFEVEIINPDSNISLEEMIEIKNWLFGQDGWRDLTFLDETQSLHLKCMLTPSEDITDVNGYRGIRCTIHNASPFWYGDEQEITINSSALVANGNTEQQTKRWGWCTFAVNIPNNGYVDCTIYPDIVVETRRNTETKYNYTGNFSLISVDAQTISEGTTASGNDFAAKELSRISFSNSYMGEVSNSDYTTFTDSLLINTKYVTFDSTNFQDANILPIIDTNNPTPIFKLNYGINICRIYYGWAYNSITFKFTPMYRVGAF